MAPLRILALALLATLASGASVPADDTYTSYRLPTAFRPEHYGLQVLTHLGDEQGFMFSGRVLIRMLCNEDAMNITLHSKNLTIGEKDIKLAELSDSGSKSLEIKRVQYITDNDYVVFHTSESMKKGYRYDITIPFEGVLGTGLLGYYRSSYVDQKTQKKIWLSVTQFEPTYARQAFPCFDEPEMKATFDISLAHHKQYVALSNMPMNRSEPMTAFTDWVVDHFGTTVPMSTYLVAYTVNDFEYRESMTKMDGDVVFKIWARRDAIDQVDYARDVGPRVTRFYEEYFAEKFPLPKIDMIAIPDFSAGAMENWGLITYRETALLYHPNISTANNKHRVASVIAHELAHQWFGNLVTMKWWTDLWLNEGFATYVASLGVEYLHPEWHSLEEESVDNSLGIFKFDALTSSHPVSVEIGHPNQISQIFDAISYEKGSTVIRMMHLFLGEETFRNGVRRYLKKHKYANAEQNDLWAALTEEARINKVLPDDVDVKTVMESWTLQTGYPVITVTRNYESSTAEITQVRFLSDREQQANATDYCWWVPLTYVTSENPNFEDTRAKDWMMCGAGGKLRKGPLKQLQKMPPADQWVLFNIQLAGLYKVRYDTTNYKLLIKQLNSEQYNTIGLANRAQLIDDAMDLAWTGEQQYGIAFAMINYLRQEVEYIPWKSALSNLNAINRLLKRTPIYGVFRSYIQFIIEPIYEKLQIFGDDRAVSQRLDATKQLVQIAAWACRFDVGDCVERSVALFAKWMAVEDPEVTNPVPRDLRSVVYCNAMRSGKEPEWNFLWQRYLKSNVGSEKVMIIGALSCTREVWLVERFLLWSLNSTSGVRKQDTTIVFGGVAKSDVGFHLAKSFFLENVEEIYNYLSPDTSRVSRFIKPLAEQMSSMKELQELKDLIETKRTVFEKATQGVKQALETVEINLQWKSHGYTQMTRFLPLLSYRSGNLDVMELLD